MRACFTYEVITPESAEQGDVAEHGWILPGHWDFPLRDDTGYHDDVLEQAQRGEFDISDLSTIIRFAQELGICSDSGNWFSSVDPDHGDYSTSETQYYSLHINDITPSSYRRIARLLGITLIGE